MTQGTHSKADWPWGFPDKCPRHKELCDRVYKRLIEHGVPSYAGFVVEKVPLPPDSTPQSGPTDGGIVDEDLQGEYLELSRMVNAQRTG